MATGSGTTGICAAILAGGQGRRMGQPKTEVSVGASSLLALVSRQLQPRCREIYLSVKPGGSTAAHGSWNIVEDFREEQTPIAGIVSLLESCGEEQLLITCCDLVCDPPELLDLLLDHSSGPNRVFRIDGRIMPFPGIYHRDTLPMWQEALRLNRLRICSLVEGIPGLEIVDPAGTLTQYRVHNINTADELKTYGEYLEGRR